MMIVDARVRNYKGAHEALMHEQSKSAPSEFLLRVMRRYAEVVSHPPHGRWEKTLFKVYWEYRFHSTYEPKQPRVLNAEDWEKMRSPAK
jgi:hypothetical protein